MTVQLLLEKWTKNSVGTPTVCQGGVWGDDGVLLFEPHTRPVGCMAFSTARPTQLLSLSYDGSLRCMDVEKAVFDEVRLRNKWLFLLFCAEHFVSEWEICFRCRFYFLLFFFRCMILKMAWKHLRSCHMTALRLWLGTGMEKSPSLIGVLQGKTCTVLKQRVFLMMSLVLTTIFLFVFLKELPWISPHTGYKDFALC